MGIGIIDVCVRFLHRLSCHFGWGFESACGMWIPMLDHFLMGYLVRMLRGMRCHMNLAIYGWFVAFSPRRIEL